MATLEIKALKIKNSLLLILTSAFVAAGIAIIIKTDQIWVGWMSIIFFCAMIPIFVWQLIDNQDRFIIDDEGVIDRTLGVEKILWHDINGAYLKSINSNDFICLDLKDFKKYTRKLSVIQNAHSRLK